MTGLVAPEVIVLRNKTMVQAASLSQTQLFCNATGNPKPNITWYFIKDGEAIEVNEARSGLQGDPDKCKNRIDDFYFLQSDDPRHLVICNPKKRHTGQYKCRAANFLDEKEGSVFINVQSEYSKASSTRAIFMWQTHLMMFLHSAFTLYTVFVCRSKFSVIEMTFESRDAVCRNKTELLCNP